MMIEFDETELRKTLVCRAPEYFPEFSSGEVTIELAKARRRRFSQIYQYSVRGCSTDRQLFVKIPVEAASHAHAMSPESTIAEDRPRLVPVLSVVDEVRLEHAGLTRMGDHFNRRNDARFGIPRVLDLLQGRAIVVEGVNCPTLDQVLNRKRQVTRCSAGDPLQQAFHNTGAWLRLFHQLPAGQETRPRLAGRNELLDSVSEYMAYLARQLDHSHQLDTIQQRLNHHICDEIPINLPLVCGHGDFGLHNVFVNGDERVIGFDTLAYWQTSPYEDLSYFLLLLEALPPLFLSRSWRLPARTVRDARDAFLEGYFDGEDIPYRSILVFEVLVALDKWASAIHSCRRARGLRGSGKRCRLVLQQYHLKARINRLLQRLDSASLALTSMKDNIDAP